MLSRILVATTVAGTVLTLAAPALADPPQEVLPLACNGTTVMVAVAPANGTFTPNFDTASTGVFKPTRLVITKQVYDGTEPSGPADVETSLLGQGKQAQRPDSVVCTGSESLPGEWVGLPSGESLLVSVTATGFFTPRS